MATKAEVQQAAYDAAAKAINDLIIPLFHDKYGTTRLMRTLIASQGDPPQYTPKVKP